MVASSDSPVPNGTHFHKTNGNSSAEADHNLRPGAVVPEPIAICGIGLRLPGGIRNGDDFWELLVNGRDARGEIPSTRFSINGFDASLAGQGALKARHGYFLEDDLTRLDTSFFSMSKTEIEWCDPQQRLLLEVVRECLDDAGELNYRGQPVGCYVGTFGQDWQEMTMRDAQSMGGYTMMGCGDLVLANRVSYEFDLRGPSLVLKTGCSASLAALHEACRALQSGDASAAVVGGTSLILGPTTTAILFNEGVLSPDSSCKTFDASANGFARAEGITAIYIKRLSDALRDGNPVRAVIRGTASNSDGRSQGLMSPSTEAHEALMRKVYRQAGLDPLETAFVECHGTGTAIGDPIETRAVGNVFGDKGVYIGSVKPNVGHSEGCSGITSVIKAVLALEHRVIPPNIKFQEPNPKIPFAEKKLTVPLKPTVFPKGRAERISVNSFGIGGSNAHVIIESSRPHLHGTYPITNGVNGANKGSGPQLLVFSANSSPSLNLQIDAFKSYTSEHPEQLKNIGYTLALRREKLPNRAFAVIQDGEFLETSLPTKAPTSVPTIAMVFSGQGAQCPGMGRELVLSNPSFRQDIIHMDSILQGLQIPPSWSILEELLKPEDQSQLHRAELAQPLSTALQIALVRQFERVGITPSAVVGHSSGEIAAAYTAGYVSLEYAIALAYYRGYVSTHGVAARQGGMMAAVGLGAAEVSRFLQPGVCVACENSPKSTTISGDGKAVQSVLAAVQQEYPDVLARPLKVDMAYHSHHMAGLATEYLDLLHGEDSITPWNAKQERGKALFFSSVTTKHIKDASGLASPYYWTINLVSPVRFDGAVSNLLAHYRRAECPNLLLEVGPHSALAGPLRQICEAASRPYNYVPSQIRGKDASTSLLSALGKLYQESVSIDWKSLYPEGSKAISGLPTYPWDHSSGPFWYESRLSKDWRTRRFPPHCLLGVRVVESPDNAPQWRNILNLEHVSWLSDHKVRKDVVFPFAAYVAMAGEAVRQVTGCERGYRLRHVVARTALLVTDTDPVEMVTALRPQRLTDSEASAWFDFAIASYTGSTWVKHCEGQVMPLNQARSPTFEVREENLPRKVTKTRLYDAMARAGIVFGPEFQRLTDISASVTERVAQARLVQASGSTRTFPGPLHPAEIDACIQLLLVANIQGLCRNFQELVVPTLIEHIEISHGTDEMHVRATNTKQGHSSATVECVTEDNQVALRISGLQVTPLAGDDDPTKDASAASDVHAAARLQWLPDFDFAPADQLIKPPSCGRTERELHEVIALLCILESADKLAHLTPCQPHFSKYRDWLDLQISTAQTTDYPLVPQAASYTALTPPERQACLDDTLSTLLARPGNHAAALGLKRISDHAAELFTGSRDALDLLMQDDLLTEIYNEEPFDYSAFVRLLSHTRPDLRILEVGAGTGGTTELVLRHLAPREGDGGLPGYAQYTFTDVSAGFFPQARERFAYAPNVEFRELDVSRDAVGQGFEAGAYDLVLAANVVHATPCLRETLANIRPLLKKDGMLLLTEISTVARMPAYIFGNFSGWWLGEADDRLWEPHVLPERWDEELKAAGYTGTEVVVRDDEMPYQVNAVIMSKPRVEEVEPAKKAVTVLCQDPDGGPAASLISGLVEEGWNVAPYKLGGELPLVGQNLIACLDLETHFFDQEALTEDNFVAFQTLLRHVKDGNSHILWLSPPYQVDCHDPRGAQSLGLIRTIRGELGLPLFTLELDYEREQPHAARLISSVFSKKVVNAQPTTTLNPDREFAIANGRVLTSRYQPFPLSHPPSTPNNLQNNNASDLPTTKTLHIPHPGTLSTLSWHTHPLPPSLPPNLIEVKTAAAALNFRDILLATGALLPSPTDTDATNPSPGPGPDLGLEASGTITRVGAAVMGFAAGDRVMLLSPQSTLTTRLVLDPATTPVVKIPAEGRMAAAGVQDLAALAGVPVCFVTALYALVEVGRLKKGMTVLVHSACGGVGLAAVQVCRAVLGGVEGVFATVGSEEKKEFLVERMGVGRERVFGSRDGGFVQEVMRETGGRGVDLVLNSLSGELLHESWRCVASYGMMLELGKRDLIGAGRLDMAPFLANRAYAGVDLHRIMCERPETVRDVLSQYVDMYNQDLLHLPDAATYFDAADAEQAFRHMQNGAHLGKVVVTMPEDDAQLDAVPYQAPLTLDPEATYLLVGGSQGLGASLATWLVENGARDLTVLSRASGVSPQSKALFEELRGMGCSVNAVAGSVESKEDIETAIRSSGKPVKGVFQLAMVLNDGPFLDMNWAQWNGTLGPKVRGTWNLHEALADQPLDFFWMASSLVTIIDEPGQGNYSAGCAFLEAFCQYRHSLGLPATVLNICPVDGVGYVAENPHARRNMKAQGIYSLGEHEFLDFVRFNLLQAQTSAGAANDSNTEPTAFTTPWENHSQMVMGLRSDSDIHLDDPNNRTSWRRDRRMGRYHNIQPETTDTGAASGASPLTQFLDRALSAGLEPEGLLSMLTETENAAFLARQLGQRIYELILKPVENVEEIDTRLTLAQIGLDSLMAIELRRWLRRVVGVAVSVLEIMGSGSLIQLSGLVANKLAEKITK